MVYKAILGAEKCGKLLSVFRQYDVDPHYYTKDTVFTEKLAYSSKFYEEVNKTLPMDKQVKIELVRDWNEVFQKYEKEIFKGIAVNSDIDKIKKAKNTLREMGDFEVVSSRYDNFEVMNKGVSKGSAVKILADYYGITREQIICIGDSENDLSMIKFAGLGVAMANGDDDVKEAASYVTDDNNSDGVAKAIEKFVLGV